MPSLILLELRSPRLALGFTIAASLLALPSSGQQSQSAAAAERRPVLVELFTSEGCSDCPPADALLAQLDAKQFVPGVQAIVLSEHVTYWNHLGWRDPFSLDAIDERQQSYAKQFALSSVYTPQIVVDGAAELVGSDAGKLNRAVARAASTLKPALTIADAHRAPDGSVQFSVQAGAGPNANLVAAVAENATRSEVAHGENAGRTLHHVAVVRVLKEFGSGFADGRPLQLSGANLLNAEKDGEPLRLVVFLVNPINGHGVAIAEQTLSR
jgi:hypothetical protein